MLKTILDFGVLRDLVIAVEKMKYNPNEWNKYPEVQPPPNEDMRVTILNSNGYWVGCYYARFSSNEYWYDGMTTKELPLNEGDTLYFSPWGSPKIGNED